MGRQSDANSSKPISLPFAPELWQAVVRELKLSPQQSKVVALAAQSKADKQIAADLKIALGTVRTHFERIFDRLDVHDRVELVVKVYSVALRISQAQAA